MRHFYWDPDKALDNKLKHGIDFKTAKRAFDDPRRLITHDLKHSREENRFFCIGKVNGKILTVRFTYRGNDIRIIGAGYWRKGRMIYEKEKKK